VKRALSR